MPSLLTDTPSRSTDPATGRSPSTLQRVLFHGAGVVTLALASAAAAVAAIVVSFGTSTCNDDDISDELGQLRLGLFVVGTVLALVPTGWSYLASRLRLAWWPWLAVGATVMLGTIAVVASMHDVGTFCF